MQEKGGVGLDSQVLFSVKPVLLQDCLLLGDHKTTNEKPAFASGVALSAERLGKARLKNGWLVYTRALPERIKTQFVQIKWQLLKYCCKSIEASGSYGTQTYLKCSTKMRTVLQS